jgi:RimJ/RimL family protein N-acetyltransferase
MKETMAMFAVTDRLLLRPGWIEDAPALAQTIGHEQVARNLSRVPWPYGAADAERFLAQPCDPLRPRFLITLRDTGRLIGGIGISDDKPQLGYWIARDHWRRGYATEAARAVLAIADESLRLPVLHASHATDNPASGRVLRKLGFVPVGSARRYSAGRRTAVEIRLLHRARPALAEASPLAA